MGPKKFKGDFLENDCKRFDESLVICENPLLE
jgi:hypothetical protein